MVRAPFDGVIEAHPAELNAFLKVGKVVAGIVVQDPFLVVGQLSENDVAGLTLGVTARARLVTGETLAGRIRLHRGDRRSRNPHLQDRIVGGEHGRPAATA